MVSCVIITEYIIYYSEKIKTSFWWGKYTRVQILLLLLWDVLTTCGTVGGHVPENLDVLTVSHGEGDIGLRTSYPVHWHWPHSDHVQLTVKTEVIDDVEGILQAGDNCKEAKINVCTYTAPCPVLRLQSNTILIYLASFQPYCN